VVVTGGDAAEVTRIIHSEAVSIVENENWNRGIGTSIRKGLQQLIELTPQTKAVVLLVSDQPFVTAEVVTGLIKRWRTHSKPIVASSYSETLGVPALFDASCFNELLQLADDFGAKPIIMKNRDRVSDFPFAEGATDIDTPTDYEKLGNSPPVRSPNPD
jgi:molybdenum cofactor cytidylyltransferase